ncbi:MAG: molybdopterin converting factor subunit 1 [Pseudomonadota bacterium]
MDAQTQNHVETTAYAVKLVYFSWVRERIGVAEETVSLPSSVQTVADLLAWLKTQSDNHAAALEFPDIIRVALDQTHVENAAPIGHAREIALFPPMTGG